MFNWRAPFSSNPSEQPDTASAPVPAPIPVSIPSPTLVMRTETASQIPEQIDAIIRRRQERLPQIQAMRERLYEIRANVDRLTNACNEARGNIIGQFSKLFAANPDIVQQLGVISCQEFYEQFDQVLKRLNRLDQRFAHSHIRIAFVGRARIGKSTLMQKISGLENDVIPSAGGRDCTGAKSIITNADSPNVHAKIDFFTRDEYVANINEYLHEMGCEPIHSVSEIASLRERLMGKLEGRCPLP